jgi:2-keto-4-pentenoate hydratase
MKRQLARFERARAAGMPRRGWKVAINVPEVLRHLDLPQSGVGWLDGDRVLRSGDVFAFSPGAQLLIEPEVAVHIATAVPRGSDADRARSCIGGLSPALEIVDYHASPDAGFDDIVEACMFHAASVIGEASSLEAAQELGSRWPILRVDGNETESAREDLVPADFGELVAFVSAFLAEFDEGLEAGDLILSGSYTAKAIAIAPGQEAVADHGPLGGVSVRIRE